ncbi:hypothetical protein C5167_021375 [Papaver somniferum]|uniref:Uncharacterized protein n=1 Tax=Papaver somniferum TaxID=3469 RepID=A0A4Y7IYS8_PAPSO|nr:hypothetical protein C5167_021375 [Papaver somniferum]
MNHKGNPNPLVENLSDAIENGTRDQHSDLLVTELTSNFEKCQQLLNSIAGSINTKAVLIVGSRLSETKQAWTVEGQRRKLEEAEHLLNQRRYDPFFNGGMDFGLSLILQNVAV